MKNGDWDEYWNYHMETERERIYGRSSDAHPSSVAKTA